MDDTGTGLHDVLKGHGAARRMSALAFIGHAIARHAVPARGGDVLAAAVGAVLTVSMLA